MKSRRALLAAIVVLFVGSTAATVVVATAPQATKTENWLAQLRSCATTPDVPSCTAELWSAAASSGILPTFYADLDVATKEDPFLTVRCHDGGHEAGRGFLTAVEQAPELIRTGGTPSGACNNGFLHGALDKAGLLKPSTAEYTAIVTACESTTGKVRSACNDGIGHSSFIAKGNVTDATSVCLLFEADYDRVSCLAGVIMQMNREDPFTRAPAVLQSSAAMEQITGICSDAEKAGASRTMLEACFGEGVAASLAELAGDTYSLVTPEGDRAPANLEQLAQRWADAVDSCTSYGTHAERCRTQVAASVTWRVGDDRALKEQLCARMPARERTTCITSTTR